MIDTPTPFTSRADLHVHTRHSDRPSEWLLRRLGAPESFVEPREVYNRAIAAGMSFVTISDHNKIDGALEIADLPGTFISNEVTTYFPENGAKMHILVTGINEEQFRMIQELRENIYEFRRYVVEQDIVYSVAHPLFLVNDRLTLDQFERLLVMFNRFELINGTRDPRASRVVGAVLGSLTPEIIEQLADKHGIEPVGPTPHAKWLTGGSDDHSGMYVASAHTVTPEAKTVEQFIDHLRHGRHEPAGKSGSSIHLAHCFYSIAYGYYKHRLLRHSSGNSLMSLIFKRMVEGGEASLTPQKGMRGRVAQWVWNRKKRQLSEAEQLLVDEFSKLVNARNKPAMTNGEHAGPTASEAFEVSCRMAHQLGYLFLRRFVDKIESGNLIKSLEAVAAVGPVAAAITPYLAAFKTQHKDETFIRKVACHFHAANALHPRSERRAWITDTFDDINGVTRTIKTLAGAASDAGRSVTVLTCQPDAPKVDFDLHNFEPVGRFALPEYPQQKVSFPPFLQVLEYIERRQFEEVIISTPGPMGLAGLAAAKLMHLRTVGIYHTDFPVYIRMLTDDDYGMESATWSYMRWFFEQCDTILVPSEYYRRHLIEHGFTPERIRVLRRGVDTKRFDPELREPLFWSEFGGREAITYLYVGRVSDEKNVTLLVDAFDKLLERHGDAQLAIVGDGPQLGKLKKRYKKNSRVLFTGFLEGERLSRAYASADVFVFPSTTDTFGNVVLEAHASGLPAIVTDRGGPQEIVGIEGSGLVTDVSDTVTAAENFADAMHRLAVDHELRRELSDKALRTASQMSWSAVFDTLWEVNEPGEIKAVIGNNARPAGIREGLDRGDVRTAAGAPYATNR
ncbi:MAG: glycosyltransferase [Phycisphaera sp.]|nr:glycosyltransferase [Phycisphaera sp.]